MKTLIGVLLAFVSTVFRSRLALQHENVALRHQLTVYQRTTKRPRVSGVIICDMDIREGPDKLETCLWMLRANLDSAELEPLIAALKQMPQDRALLARVEAAFNELDILQGAVLTYAPYMSVLLSGDPFGND